MIEACRQFAKKRPSLTLLICGVLMYLLALGFGMNVKRLVERDLIPRQVWHLLPYFGGLQIVVGLTGFGLIGLSAFIAARRWGKNRNRKANG